jgi:large subunit ribosomal protein L21
MATYAIIAIGGKQYRVSEGEKLLVDRLAQEEGKVFHPDVMLVGDNGKTDLAPKGVTVSARVVGHVLGDKLRIGKYRPKKGYRRHTGFRARLTQLEIEKIGVKGAAAKAEKAEPKAAPAKAEEKPTGMPKGYEEMTVAQIAAAAPGWRKPMLEAALAYERDHAARKGAIAALESALAAKEEGT